MACNRLDHCLGHHDTWLGLVRHRAPGNGQELAAEEGILYPVDEVQGINSNYAIHFKEHRCNIAWTIC
jgi:hypothetical protein